MRRRLLVATAIAVATVTMAYLAGRTAIGQRETVDLPDPRPPGESLLVDGRRVHYVDRGSGPPLVLLHGLGKSTADWEESVLPILARRWRVVAIDFFGMGLSERSADLEYGWSLWSDQVAAVLDALHVQRADVVGHSLGGTVGVVLAARHPNRVRRLALVGSAQSVPWYFIAWLTPGLGELMLASVAHWGDQPRFSEAHRQRAAEAYRVRGTRGALLRYTRRSPFEAAGLSAAFSALDLPILQLHGTRDREVPHAAAVRLNEELATSQLVSLSDETHYLMFDAPTCFVAELTRFLEASDTSGWPPAERHVTRRCDRDS